MEKKLFTHFVLGKSAVGINIFVNPDGSAVCSYVKLQEQKQGVVIVDTAIGKTFVSVLELIDPNIPVFVSVDGKGFIIKDIAELGDMKATSIIHNVIPNAKPDDFLFQSSLLPSNRRLVALCRRDALMAFIEPIVAKKCFVCGLSIGFFDTVSIIPALQNSPLLLPHWTVHFDQSGMLSFFREENEQCSIQLENELIDSSIFSAYASALAFFLNIQVTGSLHDIATRGKQDFFFYRLIKKTAVSLIVCLFVLLLGNYFWFDRLYSREQMLSQKLASNEALFQKYQAIKQDLDNKNIIVNAAGGYAPSRYSFYADRIALMLPSSIILSSMEFSPLGGKIKEDVQLVFTPHILIISGSVQTGADLYRWLGILNKEKWVHSATIKNYTHESGRISGSFTISVELERMADVKE